MNTIINFSAVTDYSGEPPVVTYSNQVTTVVKNPAPVPIIRSFFHCPSCYWQSLVTSGCNGCCNCNNCCCNNCENQCCGCWSD